MGKSNNLYNKCEQVNGKENNLQTSLKEYEITVLENINHCFIDQFVKFFSSFMKSSIKFVSCNMKLSSFCSDKKITENLRCLNLIQMSPYNNQSFVIFPYDFLSVIIDILFGGRGIVTDKTKNIKNITSTESLINQKIIKFITNSLTDIYKKYFSSETNLINTKTFYDVKKSNIDLNTVFLINSFNFNINNIDVYFDILMPISIFKYINKKIVISVENNNKNTNIEKQIKNSISFNDIYDVKLNIITKIIGISISHNEIVNLSVGDVLSINKPNEIVGFIEDQAIFFGNYKSFNEQSIVFIEEFIDSNMESNQNKEYCNE